MYQTITNEKRFNVVYMITNKLDGKSYIGSALDFVQRQYEHLSDLNKKVHHNIYFERAWYKHGSENFIFEIVDQVDDPEKLVECEQWWMDSFDFDWLYNILPTTYSRLGGKHTTESKQKMSKIQQGKKNSFYGKKHSIESKDKISNAVSGKNNPIFGRKRSEKTKEKICKNMPHTKRVVQIDKKTGKFIKIFRSITYASKQTGVDRKSISCVANQKLLVRNGKQYKLKTAGGFLWKFI